MKQYSKHRLGLVILVAALVVDARLAAQAGTVTWQGDVSTNWAVADNWDGSAVPGTSDDVVINGVVTHHPALNVSAGPVTINSLSLGSSIASTLTVWSADADLNKLIVSSNCTIGPNGVLTHATNATTEAHRLNLQVNGNLTVSAGGRITGFGRGFAPMQGPGKPGTSSSTGYGGGAGHGGEGGDGWETNDTGGTVYGSITAPTALGSGGKLLQGGGAVILNVAGLTTVSGTIDANAPTNVGAFPAGSGGSVFLTTGSLGGNGTISADGGICTHVRSGQGGGGRVAVVLTNSADFGSVLITAYGGGIVYPLICSNKVGGAGTVYLRGTNQTHGTLLVNNNGRYHVSPGFATTLITNQTLVFDTVITTNQGRLQLGTGGVLDLSGGTQLINDGPPIKVGITNAAGSRVIVAGGQILFPPSYALDSTLSMRGTNPVVFNTQLRIATNGVLMHEPFTRTRTASEVTWFNYTADETNRISLTISGNLTIDTGGAIQASGFGHSQSCGPGVGVGTHTGYGPGSGYGGEGSQGYGNSTPVANTGGVTYGSCTMPVDLGSGGGGAATVWTTPLLSGGGAIQLTVTGALTNNGVILADSASTNGFTDPTRLDGASGGSIFITASSLAGSGIISANGGGGSHSYAGQGGGGRVAVVLTEGTDFGNVTIRAYGGSNNTTRCGAAGTVYLKPAGGQGRLLVDNKNTPHATAFTTLPPSINPVADELKNASIIVTNRGTVALTTNATVQALTVASTSEALKLSTNGTVLTVSALCVNGTNYTRAGLYTTNNWNSYTPVPANVSGPGSILLSIITRGTVIMLK